MRTLIMSVAVAAMVAASGCVATVASSGTSGAQPVAGTKTLQPGQAATWQEVVDAGITGYVDLQYDVDVDGRVDNVRVLGGENSDYFAGFATEAIKRLRHAPLVVDGEPVRREGVTSRLRFPPGGDRR